MDATYYSGLSRSRLRYPHIEAIQSFFTEHGFNVTEEAIMFCFESWQYDYKSGFRDEENGYHLFCPCGCNDFSLSASKLTPECEGWQQTYAA